MADQDFLDALNDCIDRLSEGQSAQDCAQDYPQYTAELLPMLETRMMVRRIQPGALEIGQARDRVRFRMESRRRQRRPFFSLARVSGGFAVALIVIGIAAGLLAEDSLPGDALYGVKRITENVRVSLSSDPAAQARQFEQRRLSEIRGVLALRRVADVEFEGEVQSTNSPDWQIADLAIRVAPDVPGSQVVKVGDEVEVQASTTAQGELVATSIKLIKASIPTITPTLTSTPTTTPSVTPSPTPSATPARPTLRPTATRAASVAKTATPAPKPGVAPAPTSQPGSSSSSDSNGSSGNSGDDGNHSGSGSSNSGDGGSGDNSGKDGGSDGSSNSGSGSSEDGGSGGNDGSNHD
jgi:uncharacterized membrane protein YgcG